MRYPPTLDGSTPANGTDSSCYEAIPAGFELGVWHRTYETFPDYYYLRNVILSASASDDKDIVKLDYITYQTTDGCPHIYSYVGYETHSNFTDVKTFQGPGGFTGWLAVMSWGYDTEGDKYVVYFEPDPSGQVLGWTVMSESAKGPAAKTLEGIVDGIHALGKDRGFKDEVMHKMAYDGDRDGKPIPKCDADCQKNNNNPTGKCPDEATDCMHEALEL